MAPPIQEATPSYRAKLCEYVQEVDRARPSSLQVYVSEAWLKAERKRFVSVLASIKPSTRQRVFDLVRAAGIDVSDWARFAGGEERAASNPKYCYEWAFVESGRIVVLTIWHSAMSERNGVVSADLNMRGFAERVSRGDSPGKFDSEAASRTTRQRDPPGLESAATNPGDCRSW